MEENVEIIIRHSSIIITYHKNNKNSVEIMNYLCGFYDIANDLFRITIWKKDFLKVIITPEKKDLCYICKKIKTEMEKIKQSLS